MAVSIVDELEAVQIQEEDAQIEAAALRAVDLAIQGRKQVAGVVEVGDVIDEGLLAGLQEALRVDQGQLRLGRHEPGAADLVLFEGATIGEDPDAADHTTFHAQRKHQEVIVFEVEAGEAFLVLRGAPQSGALELEGVEELAALDLVAQRGRLLGREAAEIGPVVGAGRCLRIRPTARRRSTRRSRTSRARGRMSLDSRQEVRVLEASKAWTDPRSDAFSSTSRRLSMARFTP